jgi:hypothetical protein
MLSGSDDLAPALLRAILDVLPVLGPLFAPLKSPTAAQASFWLKAVFCLWGWSHGTSLVSSIQFTSEITEVLILIDLVRQAVKSKHVHSAF